jgi:hypothetical protein
MARCKGCNETTDDVMTRSIAASKPGERLFKKKRITVGLCDHCYVRVTGDNALRAKIFYQFMKGMALGYP